MTMFVLVIAGVSPQSTQNNRSLSDMGMLYCASSGNNLPKLEYVIATDWRRHLVMM